MKRPLSEIEKKRIKQEKRQRLIVKKIERRRIPFQKDGNQELWESRNGNFSEDGNEQTDPLLALRLEVETAKD